MTSCRDDILEEVTRERDELRAAIQRLPEPPSEIGDGPDERVGYAAGLLAEIARLRIVASAGDRLRDHAVRLERAAGRLSAFTQLALNDRANGQPITDQMYVELDGAARAVRKLLGAREDHRG